MTIQNDPDTLQEILEFGEDIGITEDDRNDETPMLVACQHDFRRCIDCLYRYGYRLYKGDGRDKIDQVEKFLKFKANSNTHYLSLQFTKNKEFTKYKEEKHSELKMLDPFKEVHRLIKEAMENMEDFQGSSEMKNNYNEIKNELELFLVQILDQCENMDDVCTILEHNPDDENDDDEIVTSLSNWRTALYKRNKPVVSHPNFQQFIWKRWKGEASDLNQIPLSSLVETRPVKGVFNKHRVHKFLWYLKNIPITLFNFFFCYTVVVLLDMFREGDILFVTHTSKKEREIQAANTTGCFLKTFDYFRKKIHTPILRIIPYFTIQFIYLIFLAVAIYSDHSLAEPFHGHIFESLCMVSFLGMTVLFLLDDIFRLFLRGQRFYSRWDLVSFLSHLLLAVGAIITSIFSGVEHRDANTSLADLDGNDPINVGLTMISVGAGLRFSIILRWLVLLENTGPIVLCVLAVLRDAVRMISIYFVLVLAHLIAFWSLYKPFIDDKNPTNDSSIYQLVKDAHELKTQRGLVSTLFWRLLAPADQTMVAIKKVNSTRPYSIEYSHMMGIVLFGFYQIVCYLLMLNLLIALMATSYSNLWQNIQMEWKYNRSYFKVTTRLVVFYLP